MSRGVRRNALGKASERPPTERPSLLGVYTYFDVRRVAFVVTGGRPPLPGVRLGVLVNRQLLERSAH
jgi:hypothetical protein